MRDVVAVFDNVETLDAAVYTLETQGFDRAAFSLLASENAVQPKLGQTMAPTMCTTPRSLSSINLM